MQVRLDASLGQCGSHPGLALFIFAIRLSVFTQTPQMTDEEQDEQFYRDTESIAFPKLNDHQLSLLEPLANAG